MPRENPEPGQPQLRQIDVTSTRFFWAQGGRMLLICTVYPDAGTAWKLQVKSPIDASDGSEVWVDTGESVSAVGQSNPPIFMSNRFKYRFSGGTTGTEIWVTPINQNVGI